VRLVTDRIPPRRSAFSARPTTPWAFHFSTISTGTRGPYLTGSVADRRWSGDHAESTSVSKRRERVEGMGLSLEWPFLGADQRSRCCWARFMVWAWPE
jgi:hypothetical protein